MSTIGKPKACRCPWLMTGAIVGLSALPLPWQQAAIAQTAQSTTTPPADMRLEEIVVTARKRSENLQSVPVAVSALGGNELTQQSVRTIANLQNVAPSLIIQQGEDDPQSLIVTMRGRKQDDASMAVDSSVSLSVDGQYIPRTIGMAGAMLDIDRVEVLRGPQGTLYGRNTTGGAIGILTNNPTDHLSGSVDVTGGNYGTWDVTGIGNIPLTDNLAARFVVQRGGNGGYDHTTSGAPLGATKSEYYRGKLRWKGDDNWQVILSGHYEHDRSLGPRTFVPDLNPANFDGAGLPEGSYLTLATMAELGVSEAQAINLLRSWVAQRSPWYTLDNAHGPEFISGVERWDVGLNISGDLTDNVQFRSITGIQHLERDTSGSFPAAILIVQEHPRSVGTYYSQEFQVLGEIPTLHWVAGAYGGYETGIDDQAIFFLPVLFGTGGGANDNDILNRTVAPYAQATWEFMPRWHLTGGVRYTADWRQVVDRSFAVDSSDPTVHDCVVPAAGQTVADPTNPITTQCPRTFTTSSKQPTWLVSLDHQLTPDVLLYAKVATGYRSGGLNEGGATEIQTFAPFAPETNVEYEAGFKSTFFDQRVRLNAAAYWDNYSNLQVQTLSLGTDNVLLTSETNAAKARIRGVEVESDFIVGGGLSLHASGAYTDAQYLKYIDFLGDHSGQPFSVPKWTSSLSANYTRPTGVGDASIQLDYAWKSAVNVVPTSPSAAAVTQPGYGLLNARFNLHLDATNTDIALFGKNLTNKFYFDQGANNAFEGFSLDVLYVGSAPRTFGLQVVQKFGR